MSVLNQNMRELHVLRIFEIEGSDWVGGEAAKDIKRVINSQHIKALPCVSEEALFDHILLKNEDILRRLKYWASQDCSCVGADLNETMTLKQIFRRPNLNELVIVFNNNPYAGYNGTASVTIKVKRYEHTI